MQACRKRILHFSFTAKDSDGDTASGVFTVSVLDAGPGADPATNAVDEADIVGGGETSVTRALTIDYGSDKAASTGALTFTPGGSRRRVV